MRPHKKSNLVLLFKSMPKGGVDTGSVFMLTSAMAERYDRDPSVLADLMKELRDRDIDNAEGNVEIRHPKGFVIGMWNGAMSTLDPEVSPPDIKGVATPMTKSIVNVKSGVRGGKAVKPYTRVHKDGAAPRPPSFHVTRSEGGDEYIDSTHDNFKSAKRRMMDVHAEDDMASPMVTSMPHGIMAFPHVDTGKPTVTPAYKRACASCHPDHKDLWTDGD